MIPTCVLPAHHLLDRTTTSSAGSIVEMDVIDSGSYITGGASVTYGGATIAFGMHPDVIVGLFFVGSSLPRGDARQGMGGGQ